MKNGKKPLSSRAPATPLNMDDIFGNALGVNPEIAEAIRAKGHVHRFINAKRLQEMGGYHPQGWKPFKPTPEERAKMESLQFGSDPEGYIRRGDCILATRPKELNEKHKAYIRQENARVQNVAKASAQTIKEFIRSNGLDMRVQEGAEVHEGFGGDDEDNE